MAHWQEFNNAPYRTGENGKKFSSSILGSSTGNAQTNAYEIELGIENHHPNSTTNTSHRLINDRAENSENLETGLESRISKGVARTIPLHGRKQSKHRVQKYRSFTHHPKYLSYMKRARQDIGADGKPIWSRQVEEAFQNAMATIEPMGRKKKSQHGKPLGRNELIAEWIFQETGELRDRKQVSSHIQVLNNFLKGIPDWDKLIKPKSVKSIHSAEKHEYYSNSIEDLVKKQREITLSTNSYDGSRHSTQITAPLGFLETEMASTKVNLYGMSFEMWVSRSDQMDFAVHNYTRLQSRQCIAKPMPLEDVRNWRNSFPPLSQLEGSLSADECEIVLVESSLHLMDDFPEKDSKLGISLELDFSNPHFNHGEYLANIKGWSSTTQIFQKGEPIQESFHNLCPRSGVARVMPPFESKWWASTLTQLTEKKKSTETSGEQISCHHSEDLCQGFLSDLTIMQEIFTISTTNASSDTWTAGSNGRERKAILLWTFSKAQDGFVGTTTWKRLIPPPSRTVTNSPLPFTLDVALPPLTMDTMIEETSGIDFLQHSHGLLPSSVAPPEPSFLEDTDEELCQDGFIALRSYGINHLADFNLSLHYPVADNHVCGDNLGPYLNSSQPGAYYGLSHTEDATCDQLQNGSVDESAHHNHLFQYLGRDRKEFSQESRMRTMLDPLTKFNIETHKMLQLQLAVEEPQHGHSGIVAHKFE